RLLQRCAEVATDRIPGRFRYAEDLANRWRNDRGSVFRELDIWEVFWERQLVDAKDPDEARGALDALRAIAVVRDDLEARVIARNAIELMLLTFPTVTLGAATEGTAAAH